MSEKSSSVILVAVSICKESLTEPSLCIVWIDDLSLEEALIRQIRIVKPKVQVAKIGPYDRVLSRWVKFSLDSNVASVPLRTTRARQQKHVVQLLSLRLHR